MTFYDNPRPATLKGAKRLTPPASSRTVTDPTANVAVVADDDEQGDTDSPQPAGGNRLGQRCQPGVQPEQSRRHDRRPGHRPGAPQHQPEGQGHHDGEPREPVSYTH